MTFVHLSDTHILKKRPKSKGEFDKVGPADLGTGLRNAIHTVLTKVPEAELFLFTGDLVHDGKAEDYYHLRTILEEQLEDIPCYLALGDHDRHAAFWEGFMDRPGKEDPYFYVAMHNGLRIVCLDSGRQHGIPHDQLEFLRRTLRTKAPLGTILILHHLNQNSPLKSGIQLMNSNQQFCEIVEHSDVRAVFTGHTHVNSSHISNGVLYATGGSTAYRIDRSSDESMIFDHHVSINIGTVDRNGIDMSKIDLNQDTSILYSMPVHDIV